MPAIDAYLVHLVLRHKRERWNRVHASASSYRRSYLLGYKHDC